MLSWHRCYDSFSGSSASSYRVLKRRFQLDDETLEASKKT